MMDIFVLVFKKNHYRNALLEIKLNNEFVAELLKFGCITDKYRRFKSLFFSSVYGYVSFIYPYISVHDLPRQCLQFQVIYKHYSL